MEEWSAIRDNISLVLVALTLIGLGGTILRFGPPVLTWFHRTPNQRHVRQQYPHLSEAFKALDQWQIGIVMLIGGGPVAMGLFILVAVLLRAVGLVDLLS